MTSWKNKNIIVGLLPRIPPHLRIPLERYPTIMHFKKNSILCADTPPSLGCPFCISRYVTQFKRSETFSSVRWRCEVQKKLENLNVTTCQQCLGSHITTTSASFCHIVPISKRGAPTTIQGYQNSKPRTIYISSAMFIVYFYIRVCHYVNLTIVLCPRKYHLLCW